MEVQTLVEKKRGCGYRRPGLYLMGPAVGEPCERLPFPLPSGYFKHTRGFEQVNPSWLFNVDLLPQCDPRMRGHNHAACPVCTPQNEDNHYMMWVGKQHYTAQSFLEEAREMGVSKRIGKLPQDFVIGHSWVFLAHLESGAGGPGVISAFKPSHVDLVVEDEAHIPEWAEGLNERLGGRLRVVEVIPEEDEDGE